MIRRAEPKDVGDIARLIRALAEYEKLEDTVELDESRLREHLFGPQPHAEVLLAEVAGQVVGFALFFHNYSTFKCQPGLYLEDLYVEPAFRGQGIGHDLFKELIRIANERNCARMEWAVLRWNEPALSFYQAWGAKPLDEWVTYRLTSTALKKASPCD